MNIGIIGFGKMGEAIAKGLLKSKKHRLYYNEIREERIKEVNKKYPQIKNLDLKQLIDTSEVIILTVKPQDLADLLRNVEEFLKREKLFLSICAGISISYIQKYLTKAKIIRAMPNMGALIGKSITCVCKGDKIISGDLEKAKEILSSIGEVIEIEEKLIDAVTAISGSGPAYFAYFVKALQEIARELGLKDLSEELVLKCFKTTFKILKEMKLTPQELIKNVASKGGTTEACLNLWEERNFSGLIKEGVKKAQERAKELGK